MSPAEIPPSAAMGRSYAHYIADRTRIPYTRHYPNLAALVGVEVPATFAATFVYVCCPGKSGRSAKGARAST
jgi:hypothetical protein